jgi:RNA polymerase-associated protein RTF1
MNPDTREQVYRLCYIQGTSEYHRPYKFGKNMVNTTLTLAHGKATKEFLMDLVSNSPITEREWDRYVKTMKTEQQSLVSNEHVKRKLKDLEKARNYVLTNVILNS